MLTLTAENVSQTVKDCLYADEDVKRMGRDATLAKAIMAEGVVSKFGFDPSKVEANKARIVELLSQLDDNFHQDKGGGHTFLNACMDRNGEQWAEHTNVDQLICLGLAIGKVKFCLPRDAWGALPGGMPYFVVL
jgi:hypothetical protein